MNASTRHASVRTRVTVLCAIAAGLAACGISADNDVTRIAPNELGPALANTTTTTTTTTTVVPTTPPTSSPVSPPETTTTTTSTTTTTIEPVESTQLDLYYVPRGDSESLRRVPVRAVPDATLDDVIRLLYEPPESVAQFNLTTAVTPELVSMTPEVQPLSIVVDLDQATFEAMTDANQNVAIAQLVLTLGSFTIPDEGQVGGVAFRVGGEPISVLIPGEGASDPGEPVGFRQFRPWVETTTGDTTTTTAAPTTPPLPTEPPNASPTSTEQPA
ncbi:MAG TPA: GerMN domain-containing protein [Ilumatobacter sp.]|nr:GerMN domain-containing protein [Ilumatobacter sp.]